MQTNNGHTVLHHTLLYGDPGGGKSTMAATAALPQVIYLTDGLGKARPYMEGHVVQRRTMPCAGADLAFYRVFDAGDTERVRPIRLIYDFSDADLTKPVAWRQYKAMFGTLDSIMSSIGARTFVSDSSTMLQIAYCANKERELGGFATEWDWRNPLARELVQLCAVLKTKPYNTVFICHTNRGKKVNQDYDETVANAPGDAARDLLAIHDNTLYVSVDAKGNHVALTQHDGRHSANNSFHAPPQVENNFAALVANARPITWVD